MNQGITLLVYPVKDVAQAKTLFRRFWVWSLTRMKLTTLDFGLGTRKSAWTPMATAKE